MAPCAASDVVIASRSSLTSQWQRVVWKSNAVCRRSGVRYSASLETDDTQASATNTRGGSYELPTSRQAR